MAKQKRKQDGIIVALWGKTPGELTDDEWDRYRRLTRMTSYYRRHERNKAQQRKDKSWAKVDILEVLGIPAACSRCGYDKYSGALDFHHRDPSIKVGKVTTVEEARKCDLLCANCHRETHAEMRAKGIDPTKGKSGRPVTEADPWLAEYMRLSGLSEATIRAAHAGRPMPLGHWCFACVAYHQDATLVDAHQGWRDVGRLGDGTVCEEAALKPPKPAEGLILCGLGSVTPSR